MSKDRFDSYGLLDWLNVHGVTKPNVASLLGKFVPRAQHIPHREPNCKGQALPFDCAWRFCVEALQNAFPDCSAKIDRVLKECEVRLSAGGVKSDPYTLCRGTTQYPLIHLNYEGRCSEILSVAHEIGHAVQIAEHPGSFIPPVKREIAAFQAELALIEFLKIVQPALASEIEYAHSCEDGWYLGRCSHSLVVALRDDNSRYNYVWNYPVARVMAQHWKATRSRVSRWQFFLGNFSLSNSIEQLIESHDMKILENYLPVAPEPEKHHLQINKYRSLGMMAVLDIDYWMGKSEDVIGAYFKSTMEHIEGRTAFIAFSSDRRPMAYATWSVKKGRSKVQITRQSAPFGDHLELLLRLKSHFPEGVTVSSNHPSSAQVDQLAW